jgi:hypothetical protein
MKAFLTLTAALLLSVLSSHAAQAADATVEQFFAASYTNPRILEVIGATANGVVALNAYVEVSRPMKPDLYCMPENLALTAEQTRDIAERYLKAHPDDAAMPSGFHANVIVHGVLETFPCK